ncbi:hypothetical protein ACFS07_17960 [Undibacterium arcticum]
MIFAVSRASHSSVSTFAIHLFVMGDLAWAMTRQPAAAKAFYRRLPQMSFLPPNIKTELRVVSVAMMWCPDES